MNSVSILTIFALLGGLLSSGPVLAKGKPKPKAAQPTRDDVNACMAAYKNAQEREQAAHLLEAKELLLTCAKPTCGSFLRQECAARYTQLNSEIPSIVPVVTDEAGAPRVDVEVRMDGDVLTSRLDGHALPVDPGMHEFTFGADGKVFATQKLMIVQGQRNRPVSVSQGEEAQSAVAEKRPEKRPRKLKLAAPEATESAGAGKVVAAKGAAPEAEVSEEAEAAPKSKTPALTYVLTGTGLVGLGGYALLTMWGRKDNNLLVQCAPSCPQPSVDHIHKLYLGADISLGVGIAALGAAYWVYAMSRSSNTEEKAEKATEEAFMFDVQPTKSGAVASVSGSF